MDFYDLPKSEREKRVVEINESIFSALRSNRLQQIIDYFSDEDTYIRKTAYIAIGRIYFAHENLKGIIISCLGQLSLHDNFKVRQTAINAAGEVAKKNFESVKHLFDKGLFDEHHSPRNAVIGSIKKAGEVNPEPVLNWAKDYLHHPDKEIRREICHGIELRGRKYPQDILPLLKELQFDTTARVRNTLVHVLGQIAYKKGCLPTVIENLNTWENKRLVADAHEEIIDVHERYQNFAAMTQAEARLYIEQNALN